MRGLTVPTQIDINSSNQHLIATLQCYLYNLILHIQQIYRGGVAYISYIGIFVMVQIGIFGLSIVSRVNSLHGNIGKGWRVFWPGIVR